MRTRATVALAVLLGVCAQVAPASAASTPNRAITGRVLDETGRGVAGAEVTVTVQIPPGVFEVVACVFTFGLACDNEFELGARTDRNGRYAVRFDSSPKYVVTGIDITGPALVGGTLPATTSASPRLQGVTTLPAYRLWMRGASLDPAGGTRRRLRPGVPGVLGRPVRPANVVLVQGTQTVWSYGEVARDRDVDTRAAEAGTTGTQSTVTTTVGSTRVHYRSGVRPVTKRVTPMSRGKKCYDADGLIPSEIPRCPLTDGWLFGSAGVSHSVSAIMIDLGALATPEAYVVRGCTVTGVSTSAEGVLYLDVDVDQREPGIYTGEPTLPARYVRLEVELCRPVEVSVFAAPFDPLAPLTPPVTSP